MFECIYTLYHGRIDTGSLVIKLDEVYSMIPRGKILDITSRKAQIKLRLNKSADYVLQEIRKKIDDGAEVIDISRWVLGVV